jgi:hypothetical protein
MHAERHSYAVQVGLVQKSQAMGMCGDPRDQIAEFGRKL